MKLSVIILNYNVSAFLELCLTSVQQAIQNIDAEVIVVDNHSPDNSCQMVRDKFPEVILIENKENYGFPKGNNIGVDRAKGEYVCILNPDTVVAEDTFEKTIRFIESKTNSGAVGVRLVDGKGCFLPESKRGVPTAWVAFTKIMGLYRIFPKLTVFTRYYASHLNQYQSGAVDILVGAFMCLKKSNYVAVGGFDEGCFMYSDDIDLSYMLLQKGLQNYYFAETTVIHYKGESTSKDGLYMTRFRDAMNFFYRKHFRISPIFNFFMGFGVYLFSFLKWVKGQETHFKNVDKILLISDEKRLEEQLSKKFKAVLCVQKDITSIECFLKKNDSKYVEIIFDNQFVSFKKIIQTIVTCNAKQVTYKILAKGTKVLVGSDSSNARGEVIDL